ncbi:hypothetical protein INH39_26810 [Massilia violaceinigra]|uniref:Uncharacterized protein n=1 Tax=Massilia violaceinigra TaxID=2045208 RepID=A0ABY4A2M2_9BURK|nr:hypothetical protein INH39_26810 [Massilia violaceinigra]
MASAAWPFFYHGQDGIALVDAAHQDCQLGIADMGQRIGLPDRIGQAVGKRAEQGATGSHKRAMQIRVALGRDPDRGSALGRPPCTASHPCACRSPRLRQTRPDSTFCHSPA